MVQILDPGLVAALAGRSLTYDAVGATRETAPAGYHRIARSRRVRSSFDRAAELLMSWRVQERAGLLVAASSPTVRTDAVVRMTLGVGLPGGGSLGLRIPCRVVYVVDEPDRVGFGYGTLPGHPESGEEAFVLERRPAVPPDDGGEVVFTVSAFSRPATALARLGGPVSRRLQSVMTDRYLGAVDRDR